MKDASEDKQDEELIASNTVNITRSKSRSERAEELRKMMEDEGKMISVRQGIDLTTNEARRRRSRRRRGGYSTNLSTIRTCRRFPLTERKFY